jgi:hypothetical protein
MKENKHRLIQELDWAVSQRENPFYSGNLSPLLLHMANNFTNKGAPAKE